MKTLPISEELLRDICRCFMAMEPDRSSLVDSCLEAAVYDRLKEDFPDFMKEGFSEEDLDYFFEQFEDDHLVVFNLE